MLQAGSSNSKHNVMLGKKIPHPKSTLFDHFDSDPHPPPAKRLKTEPGTSDRPEIPDSDLESGDEEIQSEEHTSSRRTDLESALPPIDTDRNAIEAYEAGKTDTNSTSDDLNIQERLDGRHWVKGRSSIYVDAFNLALETVLSEEAHLFDDAEQAVFDTWKSLSYEAQFLYVRLFLRKTSSWHRVSRLGYHSDISELPQAIEDLQKARELPSVSSQIEEHPGELEPPADSTLGATFSFADRSEDCIKTLEEASSLLLLDELKAIAKDAKVQGKNKKELLQALRRTSGKQTGLGWSGLKRSDTEETIVSNRSRSESREATPGRTENRDSHFLGKILSETGPCIRLSLPALKLFERVHLVFYRSTEWTEKSLTTLILARIARRNFPSYIVSRSSTIFPSRALLLEFEAALRTQFKVDNILEFNGPPTKDSFQTILAIFEEAHPRWRVLLEEEQRKEDSIYSTGEGAYLRRLSPAWVYTRIVHKAAYVMGKLKDHIREHEALVELLDQRLFHTSRRGDWYQRKALLEEHYMHALRPSPSSCRDTDSKKKHWKRVALQTCEEGLQDQLTHLIFHHDLQKRTVKLEKSLKVPKRLQHDFGHVRLAKAIERTFGGIRIERRPDIPANTRRLSDQIPVPKAATNRGSKTIWLDPAPPPPTDASTSDDGQAPPVFQPPECSVEQMCLSSYRALGYKGFHTESSIIRTLFALLFYDILFLYIPNVFQTAYQTCPLDLHTDGFYTARMSEVNARLNQINNGAAAEIVGTTWDELDGRARSHDDPDGSMQDGDENGETITGEGGRKTCVVGLDWSFARNDLVEIATAFPPAALASVMKVLAQEYGQRGGGVPDLFLWKPAGKNGHDERGEVMFAEVKSENDRLSDTQRMWIDVLSGAGVKVELCHAVANEVRIQ